MDKFIYSIVGSFDKFSDIRSLNKNSTPRGSCFPLNIQIGGYFVPSISKIKIRIFLKKI